MYHVGETLSDLALPFTEDELSRYVENRSIGLADKSAQWIKRASEAFWRATLGVISQQTTGRLRTETLGRYCSAWSHGKMLAFAKSFLKYLTKIRLDTRYSAFEVFLEMPKAVKIRKAITSRVVTRTDIENILAYIRRAEAAGEISRERALQYIAFVILGAYTGQRSMATIARLIVGQVRDALACDKPVLHVMAKQDKIRMAHYVPLHPSVISALRPLFYGKKDDEQLFEYNSFQMWVKRAKIPMSRFVGHFTLSDLRKFCEQNGDIIGWERSNRAYVLTHGVSGVDWKHYKHPLPENVYDVYMRYWGGVTLK
ncbi:MAG: hypothetical protein ACXV5H_10365 [Halobacteriota archaeon]